MRDVILHTIEGKHFVMESMIRHLVAYVLLDAVLLFREYSLGVHVCLVVCTHVGVHAYHTALKARNAFSDAARMLLHLFHTPVEGCVFVLAHLERACDQSNTHSCVQLANDGVLAASNEPP